MGLTQHLSVNIILLPVNTGQPKLYQHSQGLSSGTLHYYDIIVLL